MYRAEVINMTTMHIPLVTDVMSTSSTIWEMLIFKSKQWIFSLLNLSLKKNFCVQVLPISNVTKNIPERKGSLAENELVFQVTLPSLGFSTFFIKMSQRTYFGHFSFFSIYMYLFVSYVRIWFWKQYCVFIFRINQETEVSSWPDW